MQTKEKIMSAKIRAKREIRHALEKNNKHRDGGKRGLLGSCRTERNA